MFSKSLSKRVGLLVLFLLIVATRLWGLNWGNGYFFHPDENNMAAALSRFSSTSLDPDFYAYGQFPLYLGYFLLNTLGIPNTFFASVFVLRAISALSSILALYFFYKLWQQLYPNWSSKIFILCLLFSPGLIQLARFGTTESILVLVFGVVLFLALRLLQSPNQKTTYLQYCLVLAVGIATKVSALIFIAPLLFTLAYLAFRRRFDHFFTPVLLFVLVLFGSVTMSLFLSPYSFFNLSGFLGSMSYETGVASGSIPVFYTRQFENSLPYLFQIIHIFPYVWGLPVIVLTFFSLIYLSLKFFKSPTVNPGLVIVLLSGFTYFAYFGQLFAKWTRFQAPIFFVGPLLTSLFLIRLKQPYRLLLLFLSLVPGVLFLKIYYNPDVRLTSSRWLIANLPFGSSILSEGGNVVNLPLFPHNFIVNNFDFYQLDSDIQLANQLENLRQQSDYILVPSRRIFKNQSNTRYPISNSYYQTLFNNSSDFQLIKTFNPSAYFILNPENAEETFTVFDQPTIRVFEKK